MPKSTKWPHESVFTVIFVKWAELCSTFVQVSMTNFKIENLFLPEATLRFQEVIFE